MLSCTHPLLISLSENFGQRPIFPGRLLFMAWIKTISEEDAEGDLKREYEAARKRAGGVANILRVMSLNAKTLRASMRLYQSTMHFDSPLSRATREMLAVVVSKTNHCYY